MPEKKGKVNKEEAARIKAGLHARGLNYSDVARKAKRSWFMVWAVLNPKEDGTPRKVSAHVAEKLRELSGVNDHGRAP